ncbi:unnamed protein product, partial [Linum tenue]
GGKNPPATTPKLAVPFDPPHSQPPPHPHLQITIATRPIAIFSEQLRHPPATISRRALLRPSKTPLPPPNTATTVRPNFPDLGCHPISIFIFSPVASFATESVNTAYEELIDSRWIPKSPATSAVQSAVHIAQKLSRHQNRLTRRDSTPEFPQWIAFQTQLHLCLPPLNCSLFQSSDSVSETTARSTPDCGRASTRNSTLLTGLLGPGHKLPLPFLGFALEPSVF